MGTTAHTRHCKTQGTLVSQPNYQIPFPARPALSWEKAEQPRGTHATNKKEMATKEGRETAKDMVTGAPQRCGKMGDKTMYGSRRGQDPKD